MKSILFIISVGLLYLISSCASHKKIISSKDLKEYYYPIEDLKEPVVYHYKTDEELNEDVFWRISKEIDNGITYLKSDVYSYDENGKLSKIEEAKEEITKKGAFIIEHVEYEQDDFGNIFKLNSTMDDNCVFIWKIKPDEKIKWNYTSQSKVFENRKTFVTRTSQLERTEEQIIFNGKKYKAIVFKDYFLFDYVNSETKEIESSFQIQQTSFYAKGIGLVSYILKLPNGFEMTFTLAEIIPIDDFNRRLDN